MTRIDGIALEPGQTILAGFAYWHDGLAMLAIRREHAVEPGEVQSRTRNQRRQAGDAVEWVEDDVGGAVAKRLLEPIDDTSPIVGREPLVGDGGPGYATAELLEPVALGGCANAQPAPPGSFAAVICNPDPDNPTNSQDQIATTSLGSQWTLQLRVRLQFGTVSATGRRIV